MTDDSCIYYYYYCYCYHYYYKGVLGFYCNHSEADWQEAILWGFGEVYPVLGSTPASEFPGGVSDSS